jgi:hypothetical protein
MAVIDEINRTFPKLSPSCRFRINIWQARIGGELGAKEAKGPTAVPRTQEQESP